MEASQGRGAGSVKVCFLASRKPREIALGDAFCRGVVEHGDEARFKWSDAGRASTEGFDAVAMFGVKSAEQWRADRAAGRTVIMLDKGYVRSGTKNTGTTADFFRVSVNSHQPVEFLANARCRSERFDRWNLEPSRWRRRGDHIVIAGSSAKYHAFHGIEEPTEWTRKVVAEIRAMGIDRQILYRPKTSWREAVPVEGTIFSQAKEKIANYLDGAHALITHGSSACFEAVLMGVPAIVLGDAIAKPISSTSLADLENPLMVKKRKKLRWLYNLAYCQFTIAEFSDGTAWSVIRPQISG